MELSPILQAYSNTQWNGRKQDLIAHLQAAASLPNLKFRFGMHPPSQHHFFGTQAPQLKISHQIPYSSTSLHPDLRQTAQIVSVDASPLFCPIYPYLYLCLHQCQSDCYVLGFTACLRFGNLGGIFSAASTFSKKLSLLSMVLSTGFLANGFLPVSGPGLLAKGLLSLGPLTTLK